MVPKIDTATFFKDITVCDEDNDELNLSDF